MIGRGAFLLLLVATAMSASAGTTEPKPPARSQLIEGDARIIHALNRLTFGIHPGDIEDVRRIGLEKWFDEQIHPEHLDKTDLDRRLARFPALKLSPAELVRKFPTFNVVYMVDHHRLTVPDDPIEKAIYADGSARLEVGVKPRLAPLSNDDTKLTPDVQAIFDLPPDQRLPRLMTMSPDQIENFFAQLNEISQAKLLQGMSPEDCEFTIALKDPSQVVKNEMMEQRMIRDVYSPAQLQEVMTDFWLNHFSIYMHKKQEIPSYLVAYERDAIRPNALGKFEDLLEATAHDPAMLMFLDNRLNIGPDSKVAIAGKMKPFEEDSPTGLNENYGRELMELHTVGVDGGYTQADVTEAARVMTGWTIDNLTLGGDFSFDPARHEPGDKIVMGEKIPAGGEDEGRALLHWLATRPATARFLSRKLCERFVSDQPPQSLVDRMAKSYLKSGGDIAAVLGAMFHSPEFWRADVYRAKLKTPIEFVVSAVRASDGELTDPLMLAYVLYSMGMPPYGAEGPNGYGWDTRDWISAGAIVSRMNFATAIAASENTTVHTDWTKWPGGPKSADEPLVDPSSEEARLEAILVPGGIGDSTRRAIVEQFNARADETKTAAGVAHTAHGVTTHTEEDQFIAGMLLASPEFQRR
jgi:uncharacterized protein (DUF1800 family)